MSFLRKMFLLAPEPSKKNDSVEGKEAPDLAESGESAKADFRSSQTNIFQRLSIKPAAIKEAIQVKTPTDEKSGAHKPDESTGTPRPLTPKRK